MNLDTKATGQRIKAIRKQRNLTQEKLAELADVSPHYIYELEKGMKTMSLPVLAAIVSALNISCDYILFGEHFLEYQSSTNTDRLDIMLQKLSSSKRDHIADVLSIMIPKLKED